MGGELLRQSYEHLAAFVRQMCGWQLLRQSYMYEHLACLAVVLRQPCVSCNCFAYNKNRIENEHVENLVFDVAAALPLCFFVRQSCRQKHREAAARNPEICRRRQVYGCLQADMKRSFIMGKVEIGNIFCLKRDI